MNNQPIIISTEAINEAELRTWIADTQKLTGAKITFVTQMLVTADDPGVLMALKTLFGTPAPTAAKRGPYAKKARLETATTFQLKPAPPHQVKSWRVLDVNGVVVERISVQERNQLLERGAFREGTTIHHPKEGSFRVTGKEGETQSLEAAG